MDSTMAVERIASAAPWFAAASLCVSALHVGRHLANFHSPVQLHTIRILLMVPVYALCSAVSLSYPGLRTLLLGACVGAYEAFVIWTFMALLLSYLGGESAHGEWLELRRPMLHPWPYSVCLRRIPLGPRFLRRVRQGTLQFVFVKPITESLAAFFDFLDLYSEGCLCMRRGWVYISFVNNASISIALYSLLLFYLASRSRLLPFRPVPKFLAVKLVVFVTFWQGCFILGLVWLGVLPHREDALRLQSALVCCEMFVASVLHGFAFPVSEFAEHAERSGQPLLRGIQQVLDMHDTLEASANLVVGRHRAFMVEKELEDQPANPCGAQQWEPYLLDQ